MSRSNNTEIQNPAKFFFEWKGSKGCMTYFDKSIGEKGERIEIPLPFNFLVLDRLAKINGFSDADQSGFWSNEVRDTRKEKFTVKTKKGIVDHGFYKELTCLAKGAGYAQSVYIAYKITNEKGEQEMVIANVTFSGSAIGPWIDILKGKDIYKYAVSIADKTAKQKGATKYFEPVFKLNANLKPETEAKAVELDKVLQEYLTAYFKRNSGQEQQEIAPEDVVTKEQKQAIKEMVPEKRSSYEPVDIPNDTIGVDELNEPQDDLPF